MSERNILKFRAESHWYICKIYRQSNISRCGSVGSKCEKLSWILNKSVKQTIWEVFISQKFQESVSEYVHQYLLAFLTHTFIHLQKCIPSESVFLLSNFKEKETRNMEFNFKNGFRKHNFLFKQVVVRGATEIMPIFWLGSRNKMYLWPLKLYDWLNFG